MLPVHNVQDEIAGFTGRARPGHDPAVPKYLNTPETSLYRKGDLLFGLRQARGPLAAGAIPVIVEGPFDAIAVTIAGGGRHAGLAPCGTALTARQAALLGQSCDLARTGALVAFDPDPAGRKAVTRAYGILRPLTAILRSASLGGRDPAQILEEQGADALRDTLTARTRPLLGVIVNDEASRLQYQLGDTEGPFRAMRAAATALARLLPADAAAQITQITAGTELTALDDQMRPVASPQLAQIARALPADTASEITRLADRLSFTTSDVLIEVANAVTRQAASGDRTRQPEAAHLAADSFPRPPPQAPPSAGPAGPRRYAQPHRPRPPGHSR
jgi:DNA primase